MSQNEIRANWKSLQAFTQEVFIKVGLPPEDAGIVAEVLVWANLRGVDSHGVLRIPWYVELADANLMNPTPNIKVLKETAAMVFIDADRAFGPVVTVPAVNQVIEKAKQVGIGWGLIRNATHQGAMAYYALMAANRGMAGIAQVCSPPNMAPHGARAAGLHNSPIAIAVPANRYRPLVLDMATSVAAGGKLRLAIDKGISIPEGWALASDGTPTTDPNQAEILMPFGGPKGSGLALMFECLSSIMAGNPLLEPVLSKSQAHLHNQNSIVAAIDISMFTEVADYKNEIDALVDQLKALPKAEGVKKIFVPGEPENDCYDERIEDGIPLPPGTVENLWRMGKQFEVELPSEL